MGHVLPQSIGNVPADYLDPQHPHNGDIEGHISSPNHERGFSRRTTWIIITIIVFLVVIATAVASGILYGRKHATQEPQELKPTGDTASAWTTTTHEAVDTAVTPTTTYSRHGFDTHTATTHVQLPPPKPTVPFERPQPATWPAPPTPTTTTSSLQVFFTHVHDDEKADNSTKKDTFFWYAFRGTPGADIDPCTGPPVNANADFEYHDFDAAKHSTPRILPKGVFAMDIDGKRCTLEAHGEERSDKSVGWLHCYKWAAWTVGCFKHPRFGQGDVAECGGDGVSRIYHAAVSCEW